MGQHILPGNPPVEVNLKRSARARRISLRVSALDGRVTLTLPRGVTEREGLAFASEKAEWLRRNIGSREPEVDVGVGTLLPLDGRTVEIRQGTGRSLRTEGDLLLVPGPADQAGRRVLGYVKTLARDRLAEASDRYAARLGIGYTRITLRDTRSRWGSCTADGALMFSWRLAMAPPQVLDYVAAHEVAHLAEMNHSAAFWAVVERIHGPHRAHRGWLRQHGSGLHRYRFGD